MTPSAPSTCTATWSPARCSTASRAELQASGVDLGATEDLPSEDELLAPDLTPAELAGEPVLEDAQSSPTAGLDAETLEALVQAVPEEGAPTEGTQA